jgi:hypothetical protein
MVCTCLALPLLAACSNPPARPAEPGAAQRTTAGSGLVVQIGPAIYKPDTGKAPDAALEASCKAWTLDRAGIARFFAASREYPDGTRDAFYWLPCTISGQLQAEGKAWNYQINAAATATWTSGDVVRTFGCSAAACTSLVLMMPDDNSGR